MAELLIRATDVVLSDSEKAARKSWRAGDIVLVKPDGHEWARNELSSPDNGRALFVLKIPGVTVAQVEKYLNEWWDDLFLSQQGRRRFRLVISELPLAIRNQIRDQGFISRTWPQIRGFVEDKLTLQRETE
jgi:hypothetical protein